jgi:hypothetical protein
LFNNYKQALGILRSEAALKQAMKDLHISDRRIFEDWRFEEQAYLESLAAEPVIETMEMEYLQQLVKLCAVEYVFHLSSFPSCSFLLQETSGGGTSGLD